MKICKYSFQNSPFFRLRVAKGLKPSLFILNKYFFVFKQELYGIKVGEIALRDLEPQNKEKSIFFVIFFLLIILLITSTRKNFETTHRFIIMIVMASFHLVMVISVWYLWEFWGKTKLASKIIYSGLAITSIIAIVMFYLL